MGSCGSTGQIQWRQLLVGDQRPPPAAVTGNLTKEARQILPGGEENHENRSLQRIHTTHRGGA